jgi:hypothetical protein
MPSRRRIKQNARPQRNLGHEQHRQERVSRHMLWVSVPLLIVGFRVARRRVVEEDITEEEEEPEDDS